MKKFLSVTALTLLPFAAAAETATPAEIEKEGRFSLGISESFLGHTVEAGYKFNDKLGVRGMYGQADFSLENNYENKAFTTDLSLGGAGLMLDYYVSEGPIRMSAGAVMLDHAMSGTASGSMSIGGSTYNTTLDMSGSFKNDIAPVLSVGFQKPLYGNLYISGDLGAVYTGGMNVSISDRGGVASQADLDAELADLQGTLGNMKLAPFFKFGVGVTF